MKKIKVAIQDEHTLVLQEDAHKGDLIDLSTIHEVDLDKTAINTIVKSIKDEEFIMQLERAKRNIEKEKDLEAEIKLKDLISKKDQEITTLITKLESLSTQIKTESQLKVLEEKQMIEEVYRKKLGDKDLEIQEIKHQYELTEQKYQDKLIASETALINLKEMRSKMSTKMIGESLEVHCENEFTKLQSIAFPKAKFGKDNQVSASGSKGDYIYREVDDDGNEVLSIMFEMKNEDDATATKQKNKDFFKELDKDRCEKECEYAILVSLLEKDNELYDDIVTVPDYPKMYAIRPQHFITIISFLRQGNLKTQELRGTIMNLKNQNIDITNFEDNINVFKEAFGRNYRLASEQFGKAIQEIDKTIDHLNKVREGLIKSADNLRLANNKASDLSIKRLTVNSPSVAKAFAEIDGTK